MMYDKEYEEMDTLLLMRNEKMIHQLPALMDEVIYVKLNQDGFELITQQ